MRADRLMAAAAVAALCSAPPAFAHHVVWLDFSGFDLSAYDSVNGNSPPTNADLTAVREMVFANVVEDYAPFDIYFTTVQPAHGNYTRVYIYSMDAAEDDGDVLFGCAGGDCCQLGFCTGRDSWGDAESSCEVYAGSFAGLAEWQGDDDDAPRIANAISHTASHELGHILGLSHCHSADDFVASGLACAGAYEATADENQNWHIMASWQSGLELGDRAIRDRFFSIHSSRRVLYRALQARNHWARLPNLDGGGTGTDLAYGRLRAPTRVTWFGRLSDDAAFGPYSTWATDGGNRGDIFMTGDVTGDGQSDLVYGRVMGSQTVRWFVRASTGNAFGAYTTWSLDAGDVGDVFRLADVDGDGRDDLVYGRKSDFGTTWYARLSTGTAFTDFTTWADSLGGNLGRNYLYFVGDATGDGLADLAIVQRQPGNASVLVHPSTGTSFVTRNPFRDTLGADLDNVMLADADGDGRADLVGSRVTGNTTVVWDRWMSSGGLPQDRPPSCFGDAQPWSPLDAGNAGDLFRVGDGDGDGRADLFYARPAGMTSLTSDPDLGLVRWYGRLTNGWLELADPTTWRSDAGNEGDIFP